MLIFNGSTSRFFDKRKNQNKEIVGTFSEGQKKYLELQKRGVWIPFAGINSINYCIKVVGYDETFGDEWEIKIDHDGFNIEIKDGLWISDIGSFLKFNEKEYVGDGETYKDSYGIVSYFSNKERWYQTLDGHKLYSDFWYDIPEGKYLLSIKGYARKEIVDYKDVNYGFQFELKKVDEFEGYKNPREEQYDFNVADMK